MVEINDIATPQNLLSGPIENIWRKKNNALASKKKPARPKNHFEPPRPPQKTELPEVGVTVIIWGILMHVNFLYKFLEFLRFFPDL